ncbi:coagulation factor XI-like [Zootermopsis nevadensis]|nr:coagulation factor XI-like [Zootermopsis nevadensis]
MAETKHCKVSTQVITLLADNSPWLRIKIVSSVCSFTMKTGTVLLWTVVHLINVQADTDCGVELVPQGRIVGGEDADGYRLPWYALLHPPEDKTTPICSGTLIDSHHVITAAHCFVLMKGDNNTSKFSVTLGIYNRCMNESTQQTFMVSSVVLNPNFTTSTDSYDIAIITLNQTTNYTPICLPGKGKEMLRVFVLIIYYKFRALFKCFI